MHISPQGGAGREWAEVGLTRSRGVAEKDAEDRRRKSKDESAESAEICGASRAAVVFWRMQAKNAPEDGGMAALEGRSPELVALFAELVYG
jgi:hypothetical protein